MLINAIIKPITK